MLVSAAKKGGGGKKGGKKGGGGGSALAGLLQKKAEAEAGSQSQRATSKQYADPEVRGLLFELCTSYTRITKDFLLSDVDLEDLAEAMYNAPFVCFAHDRAPGVDVPRYTYANRAGLECFDANWDELIGLDSTQSTPQDDAEELKVRSNLLAAAEQNGSGIATLEEAKRVTLKGQPVTLKNVRLFNVYDFSGDQVGQAAVFDEYVNADGKTIKVVATEWRNAGGGTPSVEPPSVEELEAAQAGVDEWAAYIRALKEEHGRDNKDGDVVAAVEQLKVRKDYLSALQQRQEEALKANMAAFPDDHE